jgi:serine/threonine protein kinase
MGVVFKARQVAFDRIVAIKMVRGLVLAEHRDLGRFHTEALAVGRLDHPNVGRVFAFNEDPCCPFLVMEYLAGGSLARRLRAGTMDIRQAVRWAHQAARGVQAAHFAGILHRDLKPGKILLDATENARVTDFGLAKLLDGESGQTVSESVIGTPAYMSPEQAGGRTREIGPLTDVWALGAILYTCLTGHPPFEGATREETLRRVQMAEPLPPRQLRPEVPVALEAIALKCLRKEPDHRYASAGDLADDLQAWLEGRRPKAFAAQAIRRRVARHGALVLCGLVALAAVLSALPFKLAPAVPESRERQAGKRVLIGDQGLPAWSNFRLGGKRALLAAGRGGSCNLQSGRGVTST